MSKNKVYPKDHPWQEENFDPGVMDNIFREGQQVKYSDGHIDLINNMKRIIDKLSRNKEFSPSQLKCLRYFMVGKSNGKIAQLLNLSKKTVCTHLKRAFDKIRDNVEVPFSGD